MRKIITLLFILLPLSSLAEGPIKRHQDPNLELEFLNVYQDLRNKAGNPINVSSGTISNFTFSAATGTSLNITTATVSGQVVLPTGSASKPSLRYTNDADTGLFSAAAGSIDTTNNGIRTWSFDGTAGSEGTLVSQVASARIRISSGSSTNPGISFTNDNDTGFSNLSSNSIHFILGGSRIYNADTNRFGPESDNTATTGALNQRWSAVWAANGTIQTSSSKKKRSIREIVTDKGAISLKTLESRDTDIAPYSLSSSKVSVPRGIVFKWKDKEGKQDDQDIIGFVGDDLPEEAKAILPDGSRDSENFYLSSVVGILSSKVRELEKRIEILEEEAGKKGN